MTVVSSIASLEVGIVSIKSEIEDDKCNDNKIDNFKLSIDY